MNFLKIASFVFLMTGSTMILMAENWDHEQLTTVEGRVYRELSVIESDATGLTFRHRDGVAKLPFAALPPAYRLLYEGLEEIDGEGGERSAAEVRTIDGALQSTEGAGGVDPYPGPAVPLRAEARSLVVLPAGALSGWALMGCGGISPTVSWPGWWADHRYGHWLARPAGRERVVREFLFLSGLCR